MAGGPPDEPGHEPVAGPELGLRRVHWVRVTLGPHVRYEAVGTAHRRVTSRVITAATAKALAARGVPLVVHGLGEATA